MPTLYLLVLSFSLTLAIEFHGAKYQQQSSTTKLSQLWSAITSDTTSLEWYTFSEAELFIEDMNTSFATVADDMPYQGLFGLEERKKLIHTVGVIGQAVLTITSNPHNYTGLFASGATELLIRFSAAQEPATTQGDGCLTPGIAIKALRSGVPSGNVFSMFSLMGQDSFNFFKHDLSNHPPNLGDWAPLPLRLVRDAFEKASRFPTLLGLSSFAAYDKNGVYASSPKFPFRIVFHPTSSLHEQFPDSYPGISFAQQLEQNVKPGTIYDVYAQNTPTATTLFHIGRLDLTTPLTTSHFGDRTMFHQHTSFESDLRFVPEWQAPAEAIVKKQSNTEGYNYPDLPW